MIDIGFVLKAFAGAIGAVAATLPTLPRPLAKPPAGATATVVVPSSPLPPETHFERTTETIAASIEATRRMNDLNVEAARQLDAVDYAYTRMLDELTAVMPGLAAIRTDNPGLANPAPVVSLERERAARPLPRRAIDRAA